MVLDLLSESLIPFDILATWWRGRCRWDLRAGLRVAKSLRRRVVAIAISSEMLRIL